MHNASSPAVITVPNGCLADRQREWWGRTGGKCIFGSMNWQAFISSNAGILGGKPVLTGTRLSVEFLLERLAGGWSVQELYDNYPGLTPAQVQAVFAFAGEMLADTRFFPVPPRQAA